MITLVICLICQLVIKSRIAVKKNKGGGKQGGGKYQRVEKKIEGDE